MKRIIIFIAILLIGSYFCFAQEYGNVIDTPKSINRIIEKINAAELARYDKFRNGRSEFVYDPDWFTCMVLTHRGIGPVVYFWPTLMEHRLSKNEILALKPKFEKISTIYRFKQIGIRRIAIGIYGNDNRGPVLIIDVSSGEYIFDPQCLVH